MYNKEFFEQKFENYNEIEGNAWKMHWRASQIHRMEKALEYVKRAISSYRVPVNICEIGCASADFTDKYYKENLMRIVGIDLSDRAIEICKKKYQDTNVKFIQGNILNIDLTKKYDLVICMDVLHYFSDEDKMRSMKNIQMILKAEGKAILMIPIGGNDDAKDFIEKTKKVFKKSTYDYVYTQFYQKYFEGGCCMFMISSVIKRSGED